MALLLRYRLRSREMGDSRARTSKCEAEHRGLKAPGRLPAVTFLVVINQENTEPEE
jgi:hypothetical protein